MNIFLMKFVVAALAGIIVGFSVQSAAAGAAVAAVILVVAWAPIYSRYAHDNPQHLWFKRKMFGWGWTPVTWQGWLVIVVYVALVFLFSLTIDENSPPREVAFTFLLPLAILTTALIRIAYRKGEKPQWEWGQRLDKYK